MPTLPVVGVVVVVVDDGDEDDDDDDEEALLNDAVLPTDFTPSFSDDTIMGSCSISMVSFYDWSLPILLLFVLVPHVYNVDTDSHKTPMRMCMGHQKPNFMQRQ